MDSIISQIEKNYINFLKKNKTGGYKLFENNNGETNDEETQNIVFILNDFQLKYFKLSDNKYNIYLIVENNKESNYNYYNYNYITDNIAIDKDTFSSLTNLIVFDIRYNLNISSDDNFNYEYLFKNKSKTINEFIYYGYNNTFDIEKNNINILEESNYSEFMNESIFNFNTNYIDKNFILHDIFYYYFTIDNLNNNNNKIIILNKILINLGFDYYNNKMNYLNQIFKLKNSIKELLNSIHNFIDYFQNIFYINKNKESLESNLQIISLFEQLNDNFKETNPEIFNEINNNIYKKLNELNFKNDVNVIDTFTDYIIMTHILKNIIINYNTNEDNIKDNIDRYIERKDYSINHKIYLINKNNDFNFYNYSKYFNFEDIENNIDLIINLQKKNVDVDTENVEAVNNDIKTRINNLYVTFNDQILKLFKSMILNIDTKLGVDFTLSKPNKGIKQLFNEIINNPNFKNNLEKDFNISFNEQINCNYLLKLI